MEHRCSAEPSDKFVQLGGVLRDPGGNFTCLFSALIPPMDINSAEVLTIHPAIKISMSREYLQSNLIMSESNSMNAVKWFNESLGGSFEPEFHFQLYPI